MPKSDFKKRVFVLYRTASFYEPLSVQESENTRYAKEGGYFIDSIFTCFSTPSKTLSHRASLLEYIEKLPLKSPVITYDLWVLSERVGEVIHLLKCLFAREARLYLTRPKLWLSKESEASVVIELLNSMRETNITADKKGRCGRPQGSVSLSKYDPLRIEIIRLLQSKVTLSEIARKLGISRSSLGDYVKSRKLKEIAISLEPNQPI